MGKKAKLIIKESFSDLKKNLSREKNMKAKLRIQSLVFIKEEKFKTRQHLADYLCIHVRTLEKWLVLYRLGGIKRMTSFERTSSTAKNMTASMHQALKEKLENNTACFAGYKEALFWLNETYQTAFKYSWLRKYLIKHFGTKLKVPRKSHIKKDEKAVGTFLKSFLQNSRK